MLERWRLQKFRIRFLPFSLSRQFTRRSTTGCRNILSRISRYLGLLLLPLSPWFLSLSQTFTFSANVIVGFIISLYYLINFSSVFRFSRFSCHLFQIQSFLKNCAINDPADTFWHLWERFCDVHPPLLHQERFFCHATLVIKRQYQQNSFESIWNMSAGLKFLPQINYSLQSY